MGIEVVKRLIALCLIVMFVGMPAQAGDNLLSDDLLNDNLLGDDLYDGGDLFADDALLEESIIVAQNKPLQLSVEHTLTLNPQASYQRTNHSTDARLSSEAPVGLWGYGALELKAIQYWQGDTNKSVTGHFSLLEVERLVLQYSLADISIKFGRYIQSWGEVEGSGVLDVINPAPSLTSSETGFTPQWLVSGSYYLPSAQVSWFVGLDPSVTELPSVVLTTSVAKEWGAKYGHTGAGSDWAIYTGYMVPNTPVRNLATAMASAKAYQLIGYSWNKAIDDDLVKFDVAYKRGLEHNLGYTGLTANDRLDTALGLELNNGDRQWNASLTAQHWLNYQASYLTSALVPVASNRTDVTYSLGVNDSFNNDEFNWSLTHIGTPDGALRALTGEIAWIPTDQWQSSLSCATMSAKSNTVYALLDGTQRLTFKAKFSY